MDRATTDRSPALEKREKYVEYDWKVSTAHLNTKQQNAKVKTPSNK